MNYLGGGAPRPLAKGDGLFVSLASGTTRYNEFPQIGCLPSGYTVRQQPKGFRWKTAVKMWQKSGWRKDEGNRDSDYLRYYCGDKGSSKTYVEIRYEIYYQHYILRVSCGKNPNAAERLFSQFGGFLNGYLWWRVLDSPFYEMRRCELKDVFDSTPALKEALYPWFDTAIKAID